MVRGDTPPVVVIAHARARPSLLVRSSRWRGGGGLGLVDRFSVLVLLLRIMLVDGVAVLVDGVARCVVNVDLVYLFRMFHYYAS